MCESYNYQYETDFKTLVPCNLYGENDNFDPKSSHFLPALIRKIDNFKRGDTKSIKLWGDGKAKRELMHVDDLAEAAIHFMKKTFRKLHKCRDGETIINYRLCKKNM